MQRRTLAVLAVLGLVLLAGCAADGGSSAAAPNETTPPATNETATDGDATGDVDGNETEPQNETDPGPTDAELAQADVDAAQVALQDAVGELDVQVGGNVGLGARPTAAQTIDAAPIRDSLAETRDAVSAAREHDTNASQDATLDAVGDGEAWLRGVVDAQEPRHEAYLQAHYVVEDASLGDANASADGEPARRAADELAPAVETVRERADAFGGDDANLTVALSASAVAEQTALLEAELGAVRDVADTVETAAGADRTFWTEYGTDADEGAVQEAESEYDVVASLGAPTALEGAGSYLGCYAGSMSEAALAFSASISASVAGDHERAADYNDELDAAVDDAEACSLDWSGP